MTALLTGQDLIRLSERDKRYELIRGRLVESDIPGGSHGICAARIAAQLDKFVEDRQLGTVSLRSGFYVERDPDTVRGPDLLFFSKERLDPNVEVEGFYEVVPDLVVEILSPSNTRAEVEQKVEEYLRAGVRLVWVVDSRRRNMTIHPGGGRRDAHRE